MLKHRKHPDMDTEMYIATDPPYLRQYDHRITDAQNFDELAAAVSALDDTPQIAVLYGQQPASPLLEQTDEADTDTPNQDGDTQRTDTPT